MVTKQSGTEVSGAMVSAPAVSGTVVSGAMVSAPVVSGNCSLRGDGLRNGGIGACGVGNCSLRDDGLRNGGIGACSVGNCSLRDDGLRGDGIGACGVGLIGAIAHKFTISKHSIRFSLTFTIMADPSIPYSLMGKESSIHCFPSVHCLSSRLIARHHYIRNPIPDEECVEVNSG